jgi:hypothetical protein
VRGAMPYELHLMKLMSMSCLFINETFFLFFPS